MTQPTMANERTDAPDTTDAADTAEAANSADSTASAGSTKPPGNAGRTTRPLWPRASGGAPWPALGAAVVVVVVAAVTQPLGVVGVAGIVTGIAVVAVPATVVMTSRAAARRLLRPLPLLAVAAALALMAAGTVRAAGWLYALCVLTAIWLISYALSAGRRWPAVLLGGGAAVAGMVRGRAWLIDGIRTEVRSVKNARRTPRSDTSEPDADASPPRETSAADAAPGRLGLPGVLLLTTLVLVVFGSLLASADEQFGSVISDLFSAPPPDLGGRIVLGTMVAAFALGAAYVARVPPRFDRIATAEPRAIRPYEWAIPAGALVMLFAVFTVVQFTTLFGGENHLELTEGLTYATYARSGFGELVTVTVLTLGVLAAVARWAPRRTPSQRNLVRVLAGAICIFTLVIVASAVYRMDLYQEEYGLTRLRLVVTTFELWLGLVFVLILVAGIRLRAAWLPRAVVGTAVAALFGLVALNPDAYIAERNVERFEQNGRIDVLYLDDLSADAVPVLIQLPEPERSCSLRWLARDLADDDSWTALNVSREHARSVLDDHTLIEDPRCFAGR